MSPALKDESFVTQNYNHGNNVKNASTKFDRKNSMVKNSFSELEKGFKEPTDGKIKGRGIKIRREIKELSLTN